MLNFEETVIGNDGTKQMAAPSLLRLRRLPLQTFVARYRETSQRLGETKLIARSISVHLETPFGLVLMSVR